MFVLYNAALRGFPPWDVECLLGNKYETSIFVVASGITKLSKVTLCPSRLEQIPHEHSNASRLITTLFVLLRCGR